MLPKAYQLNPFGSHPPPLAANTRNGRRNTPPRGAGIVYSGRVCGWCLSASHRGCTLGHGEFSAALKGVLAAKHARA